MNLPLGRAPGVDQQASLVRAFLEDIRELGYAALDARSASTRRRWTTRCATATGRSPATISG
ncbi:MAG: hypothetical protein R3F55_16635 [Alphaproteobacteria bacterium]